MEYVEKSELAFIRESEIDFNNLNQIFGSKCMQKSGGTIFVINEDDVFIGIISIGDFRRYRENGGMLVNKNCKRLFLNKDEWKEADKCRKQYPNIKILPIIDEKTGSITGAIKLFENKNTYFFDAYTLFELNRDYLALYCKENLCQEITLYGNNTIILLYCLILIEKLQFITNTYLVIPDEKVAAEMFFYTGYDCTSSPKNGTALNFCLDEDFYFENTVTMSFFSEKIRMKYDKKINIVQKNKQKNFFLIPNLETIENKYDIKVKFIGMPVLSDLNINMDNFHAIKEYELIKRPLSDMAKNFLKDEILADDLKKIVMEMRTHLSVPSCAGHHCIIRSGKRVVPNANTFASRRLYLLGPCITEGQYTNDWNTIGYHLQEKLKNWEIRMYSASVSWGNYLKWLNYIKVKNGDMILIIDERTRLQKVDLDMTLSFQNLYDLEGQFFTDEPIHCNYIGHKCLADEIYKAFFENKPEMLEDDTKVDFTNIPRVYMTEFHKETPKVFAGNVELEKYKQSLEKIKVDCTGTVGAIVMNCNPFTLGHRYLIEYAHAQVDFLYIFVVEEDRSRFPFEDRIKLVKEGTKDFSHLKVLPSGKFIISSDTFSEYFTKGMAESGTVDTSLDVETFAQHIAPVLNITVRFVGEEPFDSVTLQYNQDMLEILPDYGIKVDVVPRKEMDGEIISASRVRKLLDEEDWKSIKKLVPETTYQYLI